MGSIVFVYLCCIRNVFVPHLYRICMESWARGERCRARGKYSWKWAVASSELKVFGDFSVLDLVIGGWVGLGVGWFIKFKGALNWRLRRWLWVKGEFCKHGMGWVSKFAYVSVFEFLP